MRQDVEGDASWRVGDEEDHLVLTSSHFLCSRRQLGRLPGRKQQLPRLVTCSPRCWAATSCHVLHPRWLVAKLQAFLLHYLSNNLSMRLPTSSACKCSRSNWWWQKSMKKLVILLVHCTDAMAWMDLLSVGNSRPNQQKWHHIHQGGTYTAERKNTSRSKQ